VDFAGNQLPRFKRGEARKVVPSSTGTRCAHVHLTPNCGTSPRQSREIALDNLVIVEKYSLIQTIEPKTNGEISEQNRAPSRTVR
jgi:hypothetical protein